MTKQERTAEFITSELSRSLGHPKTGNERPFLPAAGFIVLGAMAILVPSYLLISEMVGVVARLDANWSVTASCLSMGGQLQFTAVKSGDRFTMRDAVCHVTGQWP